MKRKFKFEWDSTEDTSVKNDDLYGGMVMEKKKRFGDDLDVFSKKKSAAEQKKLEEVEYGDMDVRDWRILKENYKISTKGKEDVPPIRKWEDLLAIGGVPRAVDIIQHMKRR